MQPTAQSHIKKTKDSRHKHSPAAQFFVMVFLPKNHAKKPSFMRLLLLFFLAALLIEQLSFFSFFLLENILNKKTSTMSNANDHIQTGNGSENFYCHRPSLMLYTDGVKDLAEACQAYWLIDLIISHQCKKAVNLERFQVWELKREKADKFFVKATDGNNNPVASQKIPFSDFPYDLATIWLVDGCMMLPTEY
jgi:hypothetical protein